MARKKKGEGFHSAAGLIRYFDAEEETAPKINPWLVVAAGLISIIILEILHRQYPLEPKTDEGTAEIMKLAINLLR
jgi:preprotein translocase subunit Sec61beta